MAFRLSTYSRNQACNAIASGINVGGAGTITIRTSTQPGTVDSGENGTLLGTLTWGDPAFAVTNNGTATGNPITQDSNADANGTAGHFRIFNGSSAIIADGTCGTAGTDLIFDNDVVISGGTIAITGFYITVPVS